MSLTPQDLIQSFDVLPQAQQQVVFTEICRRAAQWGSEPLGDEELCLEADAIFQMLDEREQQDGSSPTR